MCNVDAARDVTRTWLVSATLYFVAAASTIHWTSNGRDIAALWPANAILVALLLADDRPYWKTVLSAGFVGNIAANLLTRGSFVGPVIYGASNIIEIALAVALLRRNGPQGSILESTGSLLRFVPVSGIVAPGISGVLGAATAYQCFGEPFGKSFVNWVASDALGLLIFTPFFFAMFRGDFITCFNGKSWLRRCETVALLAVTGAITVFVFFVAVQPLLFLLFPPLMLVTFRVGRIGTKAAVMLIAIIGAVATLRGYGPIITLSPAPADQAHVLQAFLAILLLTCLPVAAEVTARARLVASLDAHDREMTNQAMTDALTGICNRAGFDGSADALLRDETVTPISLIAVDFDHFKTINDRWGHQVGDRALQHVTAILKANTRPGDVIGRLGGDEFVVLLPNSHMDAALAVSERFHSGLRATPFVVDDNTAVLVSLSIGVATRLVDEDLASLLGRADQALYAAKRAGRGRISKAAA